MEIESKSEGKERCSKHSKRRSEELGKLGKAKGDVKRKGKKIVCNPVFCSFLNKGKAFLLFF